MSQKVAETIAMGGKLKALTPREFEMYVSQLVSKLEFAKTGVIRRNHRFSGVRQPGFYEIDVSLDVELAASIKFFLIVECKNWERPVGREIVQKIAQTRDAIGADKAAIASPVGFTKEATEVARVLEIALWVITLDEWVVIYDNGVEALHLDLIAQENRDWSTEVALVHLSDWSGSRMAKFANINNLPTQLSWARFCNLDLWSGDLPVHKIQREMIAMLFKETDIDHNDRQNRRRGVGYSIGDAELIHK